MKTTHTLFAAALLAGGAVGIASQPAAAGYWNGGCCQVAPPAMVTVLRPRVVYQPQVVYEAVPAYVVPAPVVHSYGCCRRGLFSGSYGYGGGYGYGAGYGVGYGHPAHYGVGYGAGYGYGASYGYGPTD